MRVKGQDHAPSLLLEVSYLKAEVRKCGYSYQIGWQLPGPQKLYYGNSFRALRIDWLLSAKTYFQNGRPLNTGGIDSE